jgi:hypothetical protein
LGAQIITGARHLDITFICWFRVIKVFSEFCGVFRPEEVHGVGDNGSGGTITIDVQTFFESILNMSLKSISFIDEAFLW